MDASETAVGAVLYQRQRPKALLHPVAFFSRKLSEAERNYDVGDRELLAIKPALEEWRYLLEVYTDHKNLEYLKVAKRLKSCQANWTLFFTRFSFHITYRPGSKNTKPDALSRMFSESEVSSPPDTILPSGNFLMLQADLMSQIRQASLFGAPPPGTTLQARYSLLWYKDKNVVPEDLRVAILGS